MKYLSDLWSPPPWIGWLPDKSVHEEYLVLKAPAAKDTSLQPKSDFNEISPNGPNSHLGSSNFPCA